MSGSAVDRVLASIDVGLQSAVPDPTFGEVSPKNSDLCWRCTIQPPEADSTSGVCSDCRTDLLAEEPCDWVDGWTAEDAARLAAAITAAVPSFAEALAAMQTIARSIAELPPEVQAELAAAGRRVSGRMTT